VRLEHLRRLRGPNVFAATPVSLARVELDDLTCVETTDRPGFAERLAAVLPGLADHYCAAGRPGGFIEAMARGTYFGHVAEHVALELSGLASRDVHLGRTIWAGADGRYDIMTECPQDEPADSEVPADLISAAIRTVADVLSERSPDFAADLARISAVVERERLGVSTAALAAAARRRGIPVRRLGGLSMLRLGYGRHRRLVCAALTEQTSAIGVDIAADKMLAKKLLACAGIPVPDAILAWSAQEAAAAAETLGGPVVVKPRSGSQGASVIVGVSTPGDAAAAYDQAAACYDGPAGSLAEPSSRADAGQVGVIVERFVPGTDYRVLVVDGQVVAAAQLRPASVTGDGTHDIGQLVEEANADPRRGSGHCRALTKISLDARSIAHLAEQGLEVSSVPGAGQIVTLRRNANLSTGGTSRDVTDRLHPDVAAMCRRAAAVVGLDVCGIDLRLDDITMPLGVGDATAPGVGSGGHSAASEHPARHGTRRGAVIEINACPGLRMHEAPAEGARRDVAGAVIDSLYPPGAPSRIPIVAVTGTNGKTTVVRMVGHILSQAGLAVGMATTDGVYCRGRLVYEADASGPRSAEMVLDDTSVEAAVLETARGGIIRGGLGYDRADVAVITNIAADHLGADGVEDLGQLIDVKALVAEEVGDGATIVLNADDPAVVALAERPRVRVHAPVIRYFSMAGDSEVVRRHRQAGGISVELRGDQLVEFKGARERPLLDLSELPGAFGGRAPHVVANALAAVAACRALGISAKDIRRALATFSLAESNPGRGNVYLTSGGPVIVDYGHNAAALHATGHMIVSVWGGEPAAAVTLPGDRRDDLITAAAEAIAASFSRVVVYEDTDKRGRAPGEMTNLIMSAMRRARPGITCAAADGPEHALRTAVTMSAGHPVLFVYEKLAAARDALDAIGARPCQAGSEVASPRPGDDRRFSSAATGCDGAAGPAAPAAASAVPAAPAAGLAEPPPPAAGLAASAAPAAPAAAGGLRCEPAGAPTDAARSRAADRGLCPPSDGPLRRADRLSQWNRGHR
jgi:cyanophycin synthetase